MKKRMIIMLICTGVIFGGIFGYHAFVSYMISKSMAGGKVPPVSVSTITADVLEWQPQIKAVGALRAVRGVDVTTEIAGIVRELHFKSGDNVSAGKVLVQLNADSDIAQLRSLEAAAELANTVYERDKKQYEIKAISKATLDADAADLKVKKALVAQQAALVLKKTIRAPFAGRLGITMVNPGQYVNPGDKIVPLQSIKTLYADFYLPQQQLSLLAAGQTVTATIDAFPGRTFTGKITSINPKVESDSRNVLVEATIPNTQNLLTPGMFASVEVRAGSAKQLLTVPQTAVTFNPYGETVFIVEEKGKDQEGKPVLTAKQVFVEAGGTRGDQVAISKGIKKGDVVITSGQLKLKNGSVVIINNQILPGNEPAPQPADE